MNGLERRLAERRGINSLRQVLDLQGNRLSQGVPCDPPKSSWGARGREFESRHPDHCSGGSAGSCLLTLSLSWRPGIPLGRQGAAGCSAVLEQAPPPSWVSRRADAILGSNIGADMQAILADLAVSMSEFKKNPAAVLREANGVLHGRARAVRSIAGRACRPGVARQGPGTACRQNEGRRGRH